MRKITRGNNRETETENKKYKTWKLRQITKDKNKETAT